MTHTHTHTHTVALPDDSMRVSEVLESDIHTPLYPCFVLS